MPTTKAAKIDTYFHSIPFVIINLFDHFLFFSKFTILNLLSFYLQQFLR